METYLKNYLKDGWSWVHIEGSGLTNWLLFFIFELSLIQSFAFAPIPTLLKELIDQIAKKYQIEFLFKIGFDRAGFDGRDCIMALAGSIVATLIILIKGVK